MVSLLDAEQNDERKKKSSVHGKYLFLVDFDELMNGVTV